MKYIDYFKTTPIIDSLSSSCWGAAAVGPRDQSNGLEDRTMSRYAYWDGGIIKGPDGTYHMFASRWNQSAGHNGWFGSVAVHATSSICTDLMQTRVCAGLTIRAAKVTT